MKKSIDANRLLLCIGVPLMTLLAFALAVGTWKWSENKADYYVNKTQRAMSRHAYARAAEYAQKAEDFGALGLTNEVLYREGLNLFASGDFEAAKEKFLAVGVYEDAVIYATRCTAELAAVLEKAGEFEAAKELYRQAETVDGARDGYRRCLYALADEAESQGLLQEAFQQFWEVQTYSDASERALSIAYRMTGQKDAAEALRIAQGYSAEDWSNIVRLNEARTKMNMAAVAAGWAHALRIQEDGTVRAFGDNTHGQTDVSSWNGIVAVAAGAEHSIALTKDGTVLATGSNAYGQCDTAEWKHVVAIAAGAWDSYGLCADGTVLHCGFGEDNKLASLQQISRIEAGNASWIAIREDGTVACSAPSGENDAWSGAVDAAVGFGWTAVLFADGTADCTDYALSEWNDVLELTCSTTALVGIRSDGSLVTQPLMPQGAALCQSLADVQQVKGIALSSNWALILHEDDSVSLVGETDLALE